MSATEAKATGASGAPACDVDVAHVPGEQARSEEPWGRSRSGGDSNVNREGPANVHPPGHMRS